MPSVCDSAAALCWGMIHSPSLLAQRRSSSRGSWGFPLAVEPGLPNARVCVCVCCGCSRFFFEAPFIHGQLARTMHPGLSSFVDTRSVVGSKINYWLFQNGPLEFFFLLSSSPHPFILSDSFCLLFVQFFLCPTVPWRCWGLTLDLSLCQMLLWLLEILSQTVSFSISLFVIACVSEKVVFHVDCGNLVLFWRPFICCLLTDTFSLGILFYFPCPPPPFPISYFECSQC